MANNMQGARKSPSPRRDEVDEVEIMNLRLDVPVMVDNSTQTLPRRKLSREMNTMLSMDYDRTLDDIEGMRKKFNNEIELIRNELEKILSDFQNWKQARWNPLRLSTGIKKSSYQTRPEQTKPVGQKKELHEDELKYKDQMETIHAAVMEEFNKIVDLQNQDQVNMKIMQNIKEMFAMALNVRGSMKNIDLDNYESQMAKKRKLKSYLEAVIYIIERVGVDLEKFNMLVDYDDSSNTSAEKKMVFKSIEKIKSSKDTFQKILRNVEQGTSRTLVSSLIFHEYSAFMVSDDIYHTFKSVAKIWFINNFRRLKEIIDTLDMFKEKAKSIRMNFENKMKRST